MNQFNSEPSQDRIDWLAEHLFDAPLSDAEQTELFACLDADRKGCDRFVEQVMLHALLRKELGSFRPSTMIESLYGISVEKTPPAPVAKLPCWGDMHGWTLGTFFGAAITFLLLLVLGGVWWTSTRRASPEILPVAAHDKSAATDAKGAAADAKGAAADAKGAAALPSDPRFPMITSLQVKSGSSTLTLEKIGTVVLEGQADFSLVGPMKARLNRGSIKMRVTEESGRGFEVETPYGTVRDLGTEFGLNVADSGQTGLVVFDGSVDLHVDKPDQSAEISRNQRLVQGEGVTFDKRGQMDRIMSIVTGTVDTFQHSNEPQSRGPIPVILNVTDNLGAGETRMYYEIVSQGLQEDALAYVDRPGHEWNGLTKAGMPSYLLGADYVKTFMNDRKHNKMEIEVALSCPAKLYVFFDHRLSPPDWLQKNFRRTPDEIGIDAGPFPTCKDDDIRQVRGTGPGENVDDTYEVWERIVSQPGIVKLGPNNSPTSTSAMYGIAAVALEANKPASKE